MYVKHSCHFPGSNNPYSYEEVALGSTTSGDPAKGAIPTGVGISGLAVAVVVFEPVVEMMTSFTLSLLTIEGGAVVVVVVVTLVGGAALE